MFQPVIDKYMELEPDGEDTWNPLFSKTEFWHRMRLFFALNWALKQIDVPVEKIRVLDVGCGVGRSTRALLEFGIRPENIVGIDLRESAIVHAQRLNPAISFRVVKEFSDWNLLGSFDLCVQCTAFSSVSGQETRLLLAAMMERVLVEKGWIFWWDQIKANEFAGGNILDPVLLFAESGIVSQQFVSLRPTYLESTNSKNKLIISFLSHLQKRFGYPSTHCMALFRKP